MRGHIYIILMSIALLFAGCANRGELSYLYVAEAGYGKMMFNISTESNIETRSDRFELPERYIPSLEEIELRIVGTYLDADDGLAQKDYDQIFESVAAYNELLPYIPAGEYTAVVEHTCAYSGAIFAGSTQFTVVARRLDAEADLTVKLQNSAVTLSVTDIFRGYFSGGATLVVSTSNEDSFTFAFANSFTKTEDENADTDADAIIYFVDADLDIFLEGEGTKQATTESGRAETVVFSKQKIGTTAATTISRIEVDAEAAGGATITVTLNDTITEYKESDLELNPFN